MDNKRFGVLGFLGFLGLLEFFVKFPRLNLTGLFGLFFLFFIDILPNAVKKIIYSIFVILLAVGGVFQIGVIGGFYKIFFIGLSVYWVFTYFYPARKGKIKPEILSLLIHKNFSVRDGIPIFLNETTVDGFNKKYRSMYDNMAPFYDLFQLFPFLFWGGERKIRGEYLKELKIKNGDRVLEVSIGTGANIRFLPRNAAYFGLDISWGMLKQCQKNLTRWGRDANLFCGEAENLPFKNEVFDSVFHVGGFNFFNDKKKAMEEMIRVTKPGAIVLISDETEKIAKSARPIPGLNDFYQSEKKLYQVPLELVPKSMSDIKVKTIFGGNLYCLTFKKPK